MKKSFSIIVALVALMAACACPSFAIVRHNTTISGTNGAGYLMSPTVIDQVWLAPATASATVFKSAVSVSSASLVTGSTAWTLAVADFGDIVSPRNVVAKLTYSAGTSTTTASAVLFISGYNQEGAATTESITFSTITTQGVGNVAWSSITSMTVAGYSGNNVDANVLISIGNGVQMGLVDNVSSSADIIKVLENGAVSTTYTVNYLYDTITFATAPNSSNNKEVIYIKE